jgi:predicted NAD/FAD-binding protein
MSFAFASEVTGLQYAGTDLGGLFAQRCATCINPRFYHLLHHITRFCKMARADLYSGRLSGRTMGDYLDFRNVPAAAVHNYIVPMAGAIWSASARKIPGVSGRNPRSGSGPTTDCSP